MNRAFEKILEKIESAKLPFPDECPSYYGNTNKLLDEIKDIVKEVAEEYNNGWTPCSEKLPDTESYILLSFSNFTIPAVGRYEADKDGSGEFYIGDESETCLSQDMFVNAWQPLPEPYDESREKKN